jgi:hypothetical protein
MDGGDLAVDISGKVHTVWRRESKIYACEPGQEEKGNRPGQNCSIADVNGKNVYSWTENGTVKCLTPDGVLKEV